MSVGRCTYLRCDDPEHIGCETGHPDMVNCPHYARVGRRERGADRAAGDQSAVGLVEPARGAGQVVPWTGNTLGPRALEFVAARAPASLLALVGPPDAGKTTFLTYLYLHLSRGHRLAAGRFTGSYTLEGWENLAGYVRFTSWEHPRFPPHTAAGAGRLPGLLHLSLRRADDRLAEVVLTDAPGEWFRWWANDEAAADAEGARWIADRASALLLFADRESLVGPERGRAAAQLRRLAERVATAAGDRPVAVVWTKTDVEVPSPMLERVTRSLRDVLPHHTAFDVSVSSPPGDALGNTPGDMPGGNGFLDVVDWALAAEAPRGVPLPPAAGDAFLSFRDLRTARPA